MPSLPDEWTRAVRNDGKYFYLSSNRGHACIRGKLASRDLLCNRVWMSLNECEWLVTSAEYVPIFQDLKEVTCLLCLAHPYVRKAVTRDE